MWERVWTVPFTNVVPPERQDRTLKERLRAPDVRAAVLAWAVQGCAIWQSQGLGAARAISAATGAYQADMDRAGDFFAEGCEFTAEGFAISGLLFQLYLSWCRDNAVRCPMTR